MASHSTSSLLGTDREDSSRPSFYGSTLLLMTQRSLSHTAVKTQFGQELAEIWTALQFLLEP